MQNLHSIYFVQTKTKTKFQNKLSSQQYIYIEVFRMSKFRYTITFSTKASILSLSIKYKTSKYCK